MNKGLYVAASGGLYNLRQLEVIGNNLANVNTVGFKSQRMVSRQQDFGDTLAKTIANVPARATADISQTPGVVDIATQTDFSPGPISSTGNALDVALVKEGQFFVVQTKDGEAYTRAGNFTLNSEGTLVTPDGQPVAGDGGPIVIAPGATPKILSDGTVFAGGESAGKLRVVEFDKDALSTLERTEGVRFKAAGGQAQARTLSADEVSVVPGSVELPNLSIVSAMVDMISAQRSFEAYTKTVQQIDTMSDIAMRTGRGGV